MFYWFVKIKNMIVPLKSSLFYLDIFFSFLFAGICTVIFLVTIKKYISLWLNMRGFSFIKNGRFFVYLFFWKSVILSFYKLLLFSLLGNLHILFLFVL